MKKLLIALAAVAAVLVAAVLALVFLLDANQLRPKLEATISESLGRRVEITNIKVALFSGGIALEGLRVADDPAFSRDPFVTAAAVRVGVDLMPLLMSRGLRVQSFQLVQPQVVLRRAASGAWNFSTLGGASSSKASDDTAAALSVFVQKLRITGGRIVIGRAGRTDDDHVYDGVDVEVSDLSYTAPFPFTVTAKTPGGGTVRLDGQAGPFNMKDAASTPFHATVALKQVDIAATGFVDPASGVGGLLDFTGGLTSDGAHMTTKGAATLTRIHLLPGSTPAGLPVVIDYESSLDAKTERGTLKQGDVHIGKAVAHLTGDYSASGKVPTLRMRLAGKQMPVTDLQAALPAIGVTLPSGASLTQGTMDIDLAIAGPVDRLVITGPLSLASTTLSGFDLSGKMGALASFAGLPKTSDTVIETLSSALRVAPEGIQADAVNMVVPAIGTLTGAGTISPAGAMDFKMLAKVRLAIPFFVRGTTSKPVFVPDVGGVVKGMVEDAAKNPDNIKKATDFLGGLLGGKK